MDGSTTVTSKDNTATAPPVVNGGAKHDTDEIPTSHDGSSSSGCSNGTTGKSKKSQAQKQTNGSVDDLEDQRKTTATTDSINLAKLKKAAAGVELKGKIIEFMRDKPYLWNRWHPGYNDNKRRESEFTLFSNEIDYPVPEIKRVWHVLRTNFFRAHKYQAEKGVNGDSVKSERCWKYYQSMKFILESAHNKSNDEVSVNDSLSINDDSSSSIQDIRQTRSIKAMRVLRGGKRAVQRISQQVLNHNTSDSSNNSTNVPTALIIATTGPASSSTRKSPAQTVSSADNTTFSSEVRKNLIWEKGTLKDDSLDTSIITNVSADQFSLAHSRTSALSAFNEMSRISFEADDDHLYARSLMATLKKFDPTTKEVIKLKFQEIIVEYMQKQQQTTTTATYAAPTTQSRQT